MSFFYLISLHVFAQQSEWENYLLWLTDEGGGGSLWRGGNLTGFEDRYIGLLLALWITKLRESVGGSQAQSKRGRDLHIIGSKHGEYQASSFFIFFFFFFANSCAQRCLCDDSLQHLSSFTKRGGDSKKKKRMFNLLSVQVRTTFSVGEKILSFCEKKEAILKWFKKHFFLSEKTIQRYICLC